MQTLRLLRSQKLDSGSWPRFERIGGQFEGETTPHWDRLLAEAQATPEQRKAISAAYQQGANEAAKRVMDSLLSPEQKARLGKRTPQTEVARYGLVFAVEKQTAARYPDAHARLENMVKEINEHLRKGGIRREFYLKDVLSYDKEENTGCLQPRASGGKSLPRDYSRHPLDYIMVAMDEGAPGPHWDCPWWSSVEVHGAREHPGDPDKHLFVSRSGIIVCHELAHLLGLPDFYTLMLKKEENHVNGESIPGSAYNPFKNTLMCDLGPVSPWEAELVNREVITLPVVHHSWIDYQPDDCVLRLLAWDGSPLQNAEVKIYRSERKDYFRQTLSATPRFTGKTSSDGKMSLGPNVLTFDPFQALCFFLVETRAGGRTDYQWFSFVEVNLAFWHSEPITLKTAL